MILEHGVLHSQKRCQNMRLPVIMARVPISFRCVDFGDRSLQQVNRNKKSVALNFKHEESLAVLNKIIDSSDVLVENYIPGTLKKYGLDYPTLSKRKPGLVYASITGIMLFSSANPGYGQTGPYALRAGYDVMVEAEMGLMHITGITKVEFG